MSSACLLFCTFIMTKLHKPLIRNERRDVAESRRFCQEWTLAVNALFPGELTIGKFCRVIANRDAQGL